MASSIQASTVKPVTMDPLLLSSACSGSWQDLEFLLNRGSGQLHPSVRYNQQFPGLLTAYSSDSCSDSKGTPTQKASDDVEASLNLPLVSAVSLLEGVTTEGGTALHMVAAYGDSDCFLRSADIIHSNAKHLLFEQNKNGGTPLHCASQAGMSRMVFHLISLARDDSAGVDRVKELLEMENEVQETALHQAVRIGNNDIVKVLMEENSELASFPKHGTSPLYLAILLEEDIIVDTLYNASLMKLSYSGQNGQNALHAVVLRGIDLTKKLLEWNSDLTTQSDENGSTPLHFAAALARQSQRGSDDDGNTALHLAIQAGSLLMFCSLLRNRKVHLNLSNKKGQTALDVSRYKISPGLFDDQNSEAKIYFALKVVNARSGNCRQDHFEQNYNQLKHNEREELEKVKESTQTLMYRDSSNCNCDIWCYFRHSWRLQS